MYGLETVYVCCWLLLLLIYGTHDMLVRVVRVAYTILCTALWYMLVVHAAAICSTHTLLSALNKTLEPLRFCYLQVVT